jgi:hypothetical protein
VISEDGGHLPNEFMRSLDAAIWWMVSAKHRIRCPRRRIRARTSSIFFRGRADLGVATQGVAMGAGEWKSGNTGDAAPFFGKSQLRD